MEAFTLEELHITEKYVRNFKISVLKDFKRRLQFIKQEQKIIII